MVTTTNNFESYKIQKYYGVDSVEIVIGTGLFSELGGAIADTFGIRSTESENKLQKAKDSALMLLQKKAYEKGANAIVGMDIDYTEFSSNMIGLITNGTLVTIEKL